MPANKKVFIIEHRECDPEGQNMESAIVHVASTRDLAIKWCRDNLDYGTKTDVGHTWWFFISEEVVDSGLILSDYEATFVGWDGSILSSQPINGYDKLDRGD